MRSGDANAPAAQKHKKYEKFPFPLVAVIQTKSEVHKWLRNRFDHSVNGYEQGKGPSMPSYIFFHEDDKIIVNAIQVSDEDDSHLEVLTGLTTKKDYITFCPEEASHLRNADRNFISNKKCDFENISREKSTDNEAHVERCEQFKKMCLTDLETLSTPADPDTTEMELLARRTGATTQEYEQSCFSETTLITTAAAERRAQLRTNQSIISCYGSTNLVVDADTFAPADHSVLALFANFCLQAQLFANMSANSPNMQAIASFYRLWDWFKCLETTALQALSKSKIAFFKLLQSLFKTTL